MRTFVFSILLSCLCSNVLTAGDSHAGGMIDDPLLGMVVVDQFERRPGAGHDPVVWDAEGWLGYDLNKLWVKTEGENLDSHTEEMEAQVLYSRAVSTY